MKYFSLFRLYLYIFVTYKVAMVARLINKMPKPSYQDSAYGTYDRPGEESESFPTWFFMNLLNDILSSV